MRLPLAVASCLALLSTPAAAQVSEPKGYSAERFRVATDADGVLDVEWGGVGRHLSWDLALWIGGADDPVVLNRDVNGNRERVARLVDERIGGSLLFSLAFFEWIQIGLDLGVVAHQSRGDDARTAVRGLDDLESFALGDLRVVPKLRVLRQSDQGLDLALIPALLIPTSRRQQYAGDGLSFAPELAISRSFGGLRLATNLGYRLREDVVFLNQAVEDELFLRLGAGYRFAPELAPVELDLTIGGATSAVAPFADANQNPLELLGGVRYDFPGPLLAFAGAGVGLVEGYGTPDWRAFVGVRLNDETGDRDGDGIVDDRDDCPDEPEDLDRFEDRDGCPDPDNDQDRILDGKDGAPNDPEDYDGFEDEDGVPDPDNDADGVKDREDECPLIAGPKHNRGCPVKDSDADGLPDDVDQCPKIPEDVDDYEDEDGCPDEDNDADGVLDAKDECPMDLGPAENKGCPDLDTDGDGVVDRLDNCPTEPGPAKNQGCKEKQLVRIAADRLEIIETVYFDTASDRIQRRSFDLLDNVAKVLAAQVRIRRVHVEGHTDDRGGDAYNKDLSERRARAVVEYLVGKGIERARLRAFGYGEEKPIEPNSSERGRAKNRRVEFNIVE